MFHLRLGEFTATTNNSDLTSLHLQVFHFQFLADRTNGRAIGTVLRLSVCLSVVCDVMYCG